MAATSRRLALGVLASWLAAYPAAASDRWEIRGDEGEATSNSPVLGIVQEGHDLERTEAGPDEDWYRMRDELLHSYEARVFGGGVVWKYVACPDCGRFDLIDRHGAVLVPGDFATTGESVGLSVRWMASDNSFRFLRADAGKQGAAGFENEKYDIVVVDTSLFLPRFNNVGAQRTILLVQNVRNAAVTGQIAFHDAQGTPLHVQTFTIPGLGSMVLDTSTLTPLQGRSGSAILAHLGGMSALAGKGVAMDPATGFTFDTPLVGVDR